MLSDIVTGSPELIEMVSGTNDDGSEITTSQTGNDKKGSISNLKKRIASLQRTHKKMVLAILIALILLIDLLYKIFTRRKGI